MSRRQDSDSIKTRLEDRLADKWYQALSHLFHAKHCQQHSPACAAMACSEDCEKARKPGTKSQGVPVGHGSFLHATLYSAR